MPTIRFTYALKRFFSDLDEIEVNSCSIPEILTDIDEKWKGIRGYIVDEQGALRKHVNIFVNGELIQDREALSDKVSNDSLIYFFQALSGG